MLFILQLEDGGVTSDSADSSPGSDAAIRLGKGNVYGRTAAERGAGGEDEEEEDDNDHSVFDHC